jgi:uncharacterized protein
MTADDLDAPLGQEPKKRRISIPINTSQVLGGALALFLGVFVLWAVLAENPFGGEPIAVAPIKVPPVASSGPPTVIAGNPNRYDGPDPAQQQPSQAAPAATPSAPGSAPQTVTIIDGKTGQRQEIQLAAPASDAPPTATPGLAAQGPANQKLAEMTSAGLIPKVAADGMRPADAFAQPAKTLPGKPDAPRIALIVTGLGVSDTATSDAITKLPGAVTLSFMPYGTEAAGQVARARSQGHEVLLQVPMEPFDYPDNDPGPQTLLTTLAPQQNMERLYWLLSRFQGYVGIENAMGARFTSSEPSFTPILRETAKRGLIFVDDGSNPRSLAGRIAGANSLPFAKADIVVDSVTTAVEIDRALGRLEAAAREHGAVVGVSSALPASIEHIAKWAKGLESRGIVLVPITAVALKSRQT